MDLMNSLLEKMSIGNPLFVDVNQSISSPNSRKTNATFTPKKLAPTSTSASASSKRSAEPKPFAPELARENAEKCKYSLLSLALICFVSAFFTYVALHRLESLRSMTSSLLKAPSESDPRQEELAMLIWEASISISLVTVLSSIAALFVATVQLFFALKVAKGNTASTANVLRYLPEGKMIRMIVFFVWFLSVIAFLFSCILSVLLIPHPLGSVAKGIAAALGLTTLIFCAFVALHSLFSLWKLEANQVDSTTDGGLYSSKITNLENPQMGHAPRYSTLV